MQLLFKNLSACLQVPGQLDWPDDSASRSANGEAHPEVKSKIDNSSFLLTESEDEKLGLHDHQGVPNGF